MDLGWRQQQNIVLTVNSRPFNLHYKYSNSLTLSNVGKGLLLELNCQELYPFTEKEKKIVVAC